MKYITLVIGLLVAGCGTQEKGVWHGDVFVPHGYQPRTTTTKTNKVTEKPVKELIIEGKGFGEYVLMPTAKLTYRWVFLKDGFVVGYRNGKWSISEDGEIHVIDGSSTIDVLRINKDGSITVIARIRDGERTDYLKDEQLTFRKIK